MGQTNFVQDGDAVDYIPGGAVAAGAVVVVGNTPYVTKLDIAAGKLGALHRVGLFDVAKANEAFAAGDDVYWNPTGDPYLGTAGTGAASKSGPYHMGTVPPNGAVIANATTVQVVLGSRAGGLSVSGTTTAAAGSATGDAAVLPAGTARVYPTSGADGTKGVRINAADQVTGRTLYIGNSAAAILKVYPPTGGTINGGAANAAVSSVSGKGVVLICIDGTANTWLSFS